MNNQQFLWLPKGPVAVSESWTPQWDEALRREHGSGAGNVTTQVRYMLRRIAACGARRCAAITADGEDIIPLQNETRGTSSFHGELQIDIANAIPGAKLIESKTVLGVGRSR